MAKIERRIPATERFGYYSIYADTMEEINAIEAQIEKTMADKLLAKEKEKNVIKNIKVDNQTWKAFE